MQALEDDLLNHSATAAPQPLSHLLEKLDKENIWHLKQKKTTNTRGGFLGKKYSRAPEET